MGGKGYRGKISDRLEDGWRALPSLRERREKQDFLKQV
jgi:hypothetical protein